MKTKEYLLDRIDSLEDVIMFDEITSTNDYAKELAKSTELDNILILANKQTKGRGRGHKSFYSPDNAGIYMSLIIRPNIAFEATQLVTIATALALSDTILEYQIDNAIKWINDIFIDNKKVAGILVEGQLKANKPEYAYLVIGIGLNVSESLIPDELKDLYTALALHSQTELDKDKLIAIIINNLYTYIDLLKNDSQKLITLYKEKCLTLNKSVSINADSEQFLAIDIADNGNLILKDQNGQLSQINSGEVSIKNEN
ncbi:MAG: biotin--[acetyl-CoA-carboxylase] ligase [Erysipelothrix sp.]|nr:biotin--[acetyl-CoA-carboxylase] ligase [Erysipelothrix sp.]